MIKHKIHEIAKDLNVSSKEIMTLLEGKIDLSKKHNTIVDDECLNYIFDKVTAQHQTNDLRAYTDGVQEAPKKEAKVQKQPAEIAKNKKVAEKSNQPAQKKEENNQRQPKRDDKRKKQPAKAKEKTQTVHLNNDMSSEVVRENRVIDTRTKDVNLDKFNEKYERIAPADRFKNTQTKQKFSKQGGRRHQKGGKKGETEAQRLHRLEMMKSKKTQLKVTLPEEILVGELASRLSVTGAEVVKKLMMLGVMANVSQTIDFDTASLVAEEFGAKVEKEVVVTIEERLFDETEDKEEDLVPRAPVVVVMGHVDHGKTSILDYIRKSGVASREAGGITQNIGAYKTSVNGSEIVFLDTPGHEAFTAMRARGAMITDIAVLVVAADDGIMPQTIEAINHAKAAGVSIIVAINKMDRPEANPDRVMQQLTEYELVPEEWGGDVICVPCSAKTGMGIDNLLESILLVAEVKELKANPNRLAKGAVIEARLDKGRGPIATVLVQNGTLHQGDIVIAGTAEGRIRLMTDENGKVLKSAGPATPVEIAGLAEVPAAGDEFAAVENEKLARELVEKRKFQEKQAVFGNQQKITLDNLFAQMQQGEIKELPIIVKADVQGSVEAVKQSLEKLSNDEVRVRVIHGAVGAVNEGDVMLAETSGAIIIGFNVRPENLAKQKAEESKVEIRLYRVIYDAINEMEDAMKGMLAPKYRDVDLGRAEVRQIYRISSVGTVAGCYVTEGKITRNAKIRVVRDGIIVADDLLSSLRRFKDDVKEVAQGYECGMSLTKFNDIKEGDFFEAYETQEYREG